MKEESLEKKFTRVMGSLGETILLVVFNFLVA